MFWLVAVVALTGICEGQYRMNSGNGYKGFNCSSIGNGIAWWACRSYGECRNNIHYQYDCKDGEAFSSRTLGCVSLSRAEFPCNQDHTRQCQLLDDAVYAYAEQQSDSQHPPCSSFYTCLYGHFAGHQWCPGDSLFDEFDGVCKPADESYHHNPPACVKSAVPSRFFLNETDKSSTLLSNPSFSTYRFDERASGQVD
ncbi:hypothetical protein LOTGIDRAFT_238408 [Lottia gigantea]|uniref:Chitin-binding type-2 domain-containing protein n=1 Tax=Lottia gigantea TaxID=225164 RepID=V4B4U9_LOTGI|nr:hypothetical protein LOTGIDRAFT_238408 [Lottia gigantea]ESP00997.1 hypothetical protein LOTGIDRAFT_238408 [Lottia gigantea]